MSSSSASPKPPQTNGNESRVFWHVELVNRGSASPTSAPHMMIRGSGTDSPMDLWGSTLAPLR